MCKKYHPDANSAEENNQIIRKASYWRPYYANTDVRVIYDKLHLKIRPIYPELTKGNHAQHRHLLEEYLPNLLKSLESAKGSANVSLMAEELMLLHNILKKSVLHIDPSLENTEPEEIDYMRLLLALLGAVQDDEDPLFQLLLMQSLKDSLENKKKEDDNEKS